MIPHSQNHIKNNGYENRTFSKPYTNNGLENRTDWKTYVNKVWWIQWSPNQSRPSSNKKNAPLFLCRAQPRTKKHRSKWSSHADVGGGASLVLWHSHPQFTSTLHVSTKRTIQITIPSTIPRTFQFNHLNHPSQSTIQLTLQISPPTQLSKSALPRNHPEHQIQPSKSTPAHPPNPKSQSPSIISPPYKQTKSPSQPSIPTKLVYHPQVTIQATISFDPPRLPCQITIQISPANQTSWSPSQATLTITFPLNTSYHNPNQNPNYPSNHNPTHTTNKQFQSTS